MGGGVDVAYDGNDVLMGALEEVMFNAISDGWEVKVSGRLGGVGVPDGAAPLWP